MNKKYLMSVVSLFLVSTGINSHAEVEQVISSTVSNPAVYADLIDGYNATGEMASQSTSLLQHVVDGTDTSTHTVVVIYDDMKALEKTMAVQATSKKWASFQKSLSSVRTINDNVLAVQRKTWGKDGWSEGEYLAAVGISAPDQSTWVDALDEMQGKIEVKMPGMVRVVRLRGAPTSHAVLITAPTYSGLIEYLEAVELSPLFMKYRKARNSRAMGTTIYRVAKVWK